MPARVPRDGWDQLRQVVLGMDPRQLAQLEKVLPPDDLALIRQVLDRESDAGWRSTPATMAHHLAEPGEFELWPYVVLLGRQFARAFRGEDPHQVWNMPSQYGKTTLVANWGPVWALDHDPTLRLMYVSYDADKAVEEAGKARDLAERHRGKLRFRLRRDQRARGMWRTEQGGGLYATGIHGGIVGWPADALLLDDLLKGWQAAHSVAEREFVWNVWRSQLRLRVQSSTDPIIFAGTRWHEDDYFARLEAASTADEHAYQFTRTVLRAIAEAPDPDHGIDPDPLGRAPGEPLEEQRFPADEVLGRRATLGPYLWGAMEQQRPSPEEGDELQRAWWRWSTSFPPRFDDVAASWDTKLKDKETGDYCVGQVWGRVGSKFWLLDQLRGQWSQLQTRVGAALLAVRHPEIRRHFIENAGFGPEVIAELRDGDREFELSDAIADKLGIIGTPLAERTADTDDERAQVQRLLRRGLNGVVGVTVKGSKTERARVHSGALEAGDFILPEGRDFAHSLVDEAAAFPNGAHDDQVDAWSQAASQMTKRAGTVATADGALPKVSPRQGRPGSGGRLPRTPMGRR